MHKRETILVPLLRAWSWQCPSCSEEHFVKPISITELSCYRDDEATLRDLLDLEPWEPLPERIAETFVSAPESVTCESCKKVFECYVAESDDEFGEDDEDDDEDEDDSQVPDTLPENL